MSICKYCGNPIEDEPVMNPDEYGNGYHHFCLVDKEFREQNKSIFQKGYDKGRVDVLDRIRVEIETYDNFILCANGQKGIHIDKALEIIDKYKAESEVRR